MAMITWSKTVQPINTIDGEPQEGFSAAGITDWSLIVNTPTTLAGYGITDALTTATGDARYLRKDQNDSTAYVLTVQNIVQNGSLPAGVGSFGSQVLSGMLDTDFTSLSNGQTIVYNSTSGKWENGAGGGSAVGALTDLTDVVSAANTNRFVLVANGSTGYVGRALLEADISDLKTYYLASNPSGYISGNQTITLTGAVTGSGTTSISTTVASNSITSTELSVTGTGTTSQYLRSDGDGTFSWVTPPNTNYYASSFGWATSTGVLTLNRSGLSAITIDLDGRYVTSSGVTSVSGTGSTSGLTLSGTVTTTGNLTLSGTVTSVSGLSLPSGNLNNEVNKLVRTDSSGYVQFGWINTLSGLATGTPARVYCSQDAYIRYYSMSAFTTYVQANASGTWGIAVTGNAATATLASTVTVNTSSSSSLFNILWHSGNTIYNATSSKLRVQPNTGNVYSAGTFSGTNFIDSSDIRLKKNIKALGCHDLENFGLVNIKSYSLKEGDDRKQYGIIAQEMQSLYPTLVLKNETGFLSFDYRSLAMIHLRKTQLQEQEIKQLKADVIELTKKLGNGNT